MMVVDCWMVVGTISRACSTRKSRGGWHKREGVVSMAWMGRGVLEVMSKLLRLLMIIRDDEESEMLDDVDVRVNGGDRRMVQECRLGCAIGDRTDGCEDGADDGADVFNGCASGHSREIDIKFDLIHRRMT